MTRGWMWLERQREAWAGSALDLLFPPRCVLCRREEDLTPSVAAGPGAVSGVGIPIPLCRGCVGELTAGGPRCLRCGERGGAEPCRACRGPCADWDGIVVLGGYGGLLRQAVLRAKHPRGEDVAGALATLLFTQHAETIAAWAPDVIVPVPMHWWRRVVRGTSAADVIAGRIGGLGGLPVRRFLRRTRPTVMQNRLPSGERRANVRDAFGSRHRGIAGKRVLLVDDVVTTGGTLAGCRRALSAAGAAAVHVAVLARADHGGDDGDQQADALE
jgi:ComF family protein